MACRADGGTYVNTRVYHELTLQISSPYFDSQAPSTLVNLGVCLLKAIRVTWLGETLRARVARRLKRATLKFDFDTNRPYTCGGWGRSEKHVWGRTMQRSRIS